MKCACSACGKVKTIWRLGYCLDCLGERCGRAERLVQDMADEIRKLKRQLAQMGRNP